MESQHSVNWKTPLQTPIPWSWRRAPRSYPSLSRETPVLRIRNRLPGEREGHGVGRGGAPVVPGHGVQSRRGDDADLARGLRQAEVDDELLGIPRLDVHRGGDDPGGALGPERVQ